MSAWRATAACLVLACSTPQKSSAQATAANDVPVAVGESIYLHGLLASGAPLVATRAAGALPTQGPQAACTKCHRRSGLGAREGLEIVPPVTGLFLFHSRNAKFDEAELPYVETARANREAYTDATLARAIREGVDSDGNKLSYLMPRYALGDADMAQLSAYLKQLGTGDIPGVTPKLLHFATIITPDADPLKRAGMLDVMQHYFADKNTFPFPPSPPLRSSGKTLYVKSMYMAQRHWQLHVWELAGPAATWTQQLQSRLAAEPVMAVISGIGGSNWVPVHRFCEQERLPCLFPNVEVPPAAPQDFYTLYFSRGVLLEADLLAARMLEPGAAPTRSVLQIYRGGDSGESAARDLGAILTKHGIAVRLESLAAGAPPQRVNERLRSADRGDTVVLWLRPTDIAALGPPPESSARVYLSGIMGGLEAMPLPPAWRGRARIVSPFDLPDRSRVRVNMPLKWFEIRHIPVVAEQVQVDTYLACGLLAETLSHMADVFARDFLIERAETMIEHRLMTGPYPRLSLAEGQRFASKGGYLLQFSGSDAAHLTADREWTVPEEYAVE